jgi:hypothetical protein
MPKLWPAAHCALQLLDDPERDIRTRSPLISEIEAAGMVICKPVNRQAAESALIKPVA